MASRNSIAAICALIVLVYSTTVQGQAADCSQPTDALNAPPNTELVEEFQVVGTQNYTCGSNNTYEWVGIKADMLQNGQVAGYSYSAILGSGEIGGVYVQTDASNNTVGSVTSPRVDLASSSPNATSMPWIIRTTSEATGTLSSVQYLWRHDTVGGQGPVGQKCIEGKSKDVFEPYTATYGFYKCKGSGSTSAAMATSFMVAVSAIVGGIGVLCML